jgi:uncharacterized Zn finger protein (UPF0148 family)
MEVLFLAFTVLLLSGIVASLLATHKGRSGLGWLFLGFVLGPIALVVAFLPSSSTKKCPQCANRVKKDDKVCEGCGFGFFPVKLEETETTELYRNRMEEREPLIPREGMEDAAAIPPRKRAEDTETLILSRKKLDETETIIMRRQRGDLEAKEKPED